MQTYFHQTQTHLLSFPRRLRSVGDLRSDSLRLLGRRRLTHGLVFRRRRRLLGLIGGLALVLLIGGLILGLFLLGLRGLGLTLAALCFIRLLVVNIGQVVLQVVRDKLDHTLSGVQLGRFLSLGLLLSLFQEEAGIIQKRLEGVVEELADRHILGVGRLDIFEQVVEHSFWLARILALLELLLALVGKLGLFEVEPHFLFELLVAVNRLCRLFNLLGLLNIRRQVVNLDLLVELDGFDRLLDLLLLHWLLLTVTHHFLIVLLGIFGALELDLVQWDGLALA